MRNAALFQRLTESSPKRILALDGGGGRGLLTLALLERVEKIFRARSGRDDFVLADYFDLIVGTSTGAIIGSALALGHEVAWVKDRYLSLAESVFSNKQLGGGNFREKYEKTALEDALEDIFGETTLGCARIKTGLCIVTKRADTNSLWPFINHPDGRYYGQNASYPLRMLIRASTAAPTFFKSETIRDIETTGNLRLTGEFVDGDVSQHNNPAYYSSTSRRFRDFPFNGEQAPTICSSSLLKPAIGKFKPTSAEYLETEVLAGKSG